LRREGASSSEISFSSGESPKVRIPVKTSFSNPVSRATESPSIF